MALYKVFTFILVVIIFSNEALAFEFSNQECEFKVNFLFPVSVKKIVQPLGNGVYSNTYMAKAGDNRSGRIFSANCDTLFRLVRKITMSQKEKWLNGVCVSGRK